MDQHQRARRNLLIGGSIVGACVLSALLPSACAMRQISRRQTKTSNEMPTRPEGEAKPALEEDISPILARLDAWYSANLPDDKYRFNPPATDAQIDEFENLTGRQVPRAYRQLYKWHDGENDDRWGHIYGLPLLSLKHAAAVWQQWQGTLAYFQGDRYVVPAGAWPSGAVDPAYINPAWIPFTSDGSGGHIGVDFDPWPAGRVGQVILFGRDEDVKAVLAPSLGKFLEWLAGLMESGNFRLKAAAGERVLREFRLKQPPANHFHDGARMLLGAPGQFLQ